MWLAIAAISLGAALGALARWGLSLWLNPLLPNLPLGTLTANLSGGYLVGLALAFFSSNTALPPEWRLFIVTGFLGGLTTFSTFSAEVVDMLLKGQTGWGLLTAAAHMLGSFAMTAAGIYSMQLMSRPT
ncbi:fluoride efflux transporter CrcB [Chitinimonas sp. BJB300]|uniref:fluoride efflux transporter CrcB n=1 Tax=Chitinimonas sp. BJB300 TaxID=1559339 RepID=UPI000C0F650C|nr:fluoride efflux transporter CrcB [Chitinimonas sp. BJB300]PHV11125.1 fluoride efflux transporter CrcB [Chitinimonas sp. BJB300]TSJ90987.1 fluoride efflux transporter CrcB [Chitinimonas sp. BJB300]